MTVADSCHSAPHPRDRAPRLIARLRELFEDISGIDMADAEPAPPFLELGLDSLSLTQVALQLQKTFERQGRPSAS